MARQALCFYRDCLCVNLADVVPYTHEVIGYACGGLFAAGWWLFIDAVIYAGRKDLPVPIYFEDYVPGILATIALVMVNSVDKSLMNGQDYSYSGGAAWKARLFAFIGVALSVGSLGGAVVRLFYYICSTDTYPPVKTIMCVKYLNPGHTAEDAWPGIAFAIQTFLIFVSVPFRSPRFDVFLQAVDRSQQNLAFLQQLQAYVDFYTAVVASPEKIALDRLHVYALSLVTAYFAGLVPRTLASPELQRASKDENIKSPTRLTLLVKSCVSYKEFINLLIDEETTIAISIHATKDDILMHFLSSSDDMLSSDDKVRVPALLDHLHPEHFVTAAVVVIAHMQKTTLPRYERYRTRNLSKKGRDINHGVSVLLLVLTGLWLWWMYMNNVSRWSRLLTIIPIWAAGICWIQAARAFNLLQFLLDFKKGAYAYYRRHYHISPDITSINVKEIPDEDVDDIDVIHLQYWMCWRFLGWTFVCSCITVALFIALIPVPPPHDNT